MTREDIIRMAEECGILEFENNESQADNILHFAAFVAAAEREAICSIVYGLCISDNNAQEIVNAIRARGSK